MKGDRTTQQRDADEIDLRLFNAMRRAQQNADETGGERRKRWLKLVSHLMAARILVRQEMHQDDQERTNA